ncbi:glycerophosphodiester phosphodiesterase [Psychromicrobium xiongbiense]|uniref:glycerophosphodiester phosphodiesterase n=1 Tax=Psychromicrobium xiongbiense TaxID=3051184 RepID=UPI00255406D7|nr:glycerophosphodiester phosphodiesterase [Psychromicrobium sp. YIM S02556]
MSAPLPLNTPVPIRAPAPTSTQASAHRGDSSRFRENTLSAVRSAIDKGSEIVEIDVRLSASGDVVVLHDPTLERLWGLPRPISEVPTAELLSWGPPDTRPPLLAELLPLFQEAVSRGLTSRLVIDMEQAEFAVPSLRVTRAAGIVTDWCGDLAAMRLLRELDAEARLWLPWDRSTAPSPAEWSELRPVTVNMPFQLVDAAMVEAVHALGSTVTVWTVDEREDLARMISLGVDTITTNQLDLLQELLQAASLPEAKVRGEVKA